MAPELGHLALFVRDLERSTTFYRDVVGLRVAGTVFGGRAALLTGGRTHHELLLIQRGTSVPGPLQGPRIGLYHMAWKVGNSLAALREAMARVQAHGSPVQGLSDHTISQSIYLQDPDGNDVELFVDNPMFDWRQDSSWMEAPVKPLQL